MITSSANQKVRQIVRWQQKAKERREAGVFLTEGFKLFEEAPAEMVREVYVSQGALEKNDCYAVRDKLDNLGYETVTDDIFSKMSDTRTPQGILCVLRQPQYSLERLLSGDAPLLAVLENIQDPGNLGTILRTGEGAGITGVIMSKKTVDIFNPKTIRATMGSIFRVPFLYVEDLQDTIRSLQKKGIRTYAAHLEGKRYYDSFSFRGGTAFLIGNEGGGLSRETAELAEEYLKIPMEGKVESLNAAVAASLLFYEAQRQRRA
ncbi:MAG: RNA methyltransferase [Roseburia sp.]|nr:RNA methyltransferase [Roseburia sp.]MCM1098272.1 RNA methyltransferase [Ruminococcus flavefaciens]